MLPSTSAQPPCRHETTPGTTEKTGVSLVVPGVFSGRRQAAASASDRGDERRTATVAAAAAVAAEDVVDRPGEQPEPEDPLDRGEDLAQDVVGPDEAVALHV